MIATGQLGRAAVGTEEVVDRKNLHDLSGRLDDVPPGRQRVSTAVVPGGTTRIPQSGREHEDRTGEIRCPSVGTSCVHKWGGLLSAYGEILMSAHI
jgi:hypothetical protein